MGILQARMLERVAMPSSRGSSQPRSPAPQEDSWPSQPAGTPTWCKGGYFLEPAIRQEVLLVEKAWAPRALSGWLLDVTHISLSWERQKTAPAWLDLLLCFSRSQIVNSPSFVYLLAWMSKAEWKREGQREGKEGGMNEGIKGREGRERAKKELKVSIVFSSSYSS